MQTTSEVKLIKRHAKSLAKQSTNHTLWRFVYEQTNKSEDCAYVATLSLSLLLAILNKSLRQLPNCFYSPKCSQWHFMDVWIYYITEGYLLA